MSVMRIAFMAAALMLVVSGCLLPIKVQGQSPQIVWSQPAPLGEELESSWFPDIHTDPYGTVHLIWESVRDATDPLVTEATGGALMLSEFEDDHWTEPADIYVKDVLNAARPILASDDDYLHLISRSPRNEGRITIQTLAALYYMRAPLTSDVSNARSWSKGVRLTSGPAYWAQLQVLKDGTLVLVYNQIVEEFGGDQGASRTALFSRRSLDQGTTWSQPVRISFSGNRVARSSLAVSPIDGTLIVAWDEGYDNLTGKGEPSGIFTAISSDQGASWELAGPVGGPDADGRRVSYSSRGSVEQSALTATDDITVLIYRSTTEDKLLYRVSRDQGRSWEEELTIPEAIPRPFLTSHHFDKLGVAVDGDGRIILAYVGQDPNATDGLSVFSMTYAEDTWSAPQAVASPPGFPEYPRLTVTRGNQVHLAFFVRDQNFVDSGDYVIWTVNGSTPAAPSTLPSRPLPGAGESVPRLPTADVPTEDSVPRAYPTPPAVPQPLDHEIDATNPTTQRIRPVVLATFATVGTLVVVSIGLAVLRRVRGM